MHFDSECRMTVYCDGSKITIDCAPKECLGRNLLAVISEVLPTGAAVKICCGDSLYLGEVWACWSTEAGVCV